MQENLSGREIAEQAAGEEADDILRKIKRGDETEGDPDERDMAGAPDSIDTAHGREEAKQNNKQGEEKKPK